MTETLFERMSTNRGNCWHVVEHRRVLPHPQDPRELLFVCLNCGMSCAETQIGPLQKGQPFQRSPNTREGSE